MNIFKITIIGIIVSVTILVPTTILSYTQEKIIEYGCTPDFWKNNLDLWETVGVDYNDDFDETFGKDYFEQDITLKQAVNAKGPGLNHLARSGTTAYLNALVDPEIDEEAVRSAVHSGYVHQFEKYIEYCASELGETYDPHN